ncbi:MAG TPA: dihydrofolate reductase family protein [Acidimicrobiia bacterium]|nr:dihydrofolate reductase family protein [Acidimicrobiia bacterium]
MSDLIWHVTMSLDGFIAGPDDAMDWVVKHWSDNGHGVRDIRVEKSPVAEEVVQTTGAILAGRRWYDIATQRFDGVEGIYGGAWSGPVFVLTHDPPRREHDPAIRFISGELADAVRTALDAANGKNVVLFGASIPQQCLRAGLLDEIVIHLVPVLLGDGIRLYERPGGEPLGLRRTVAAESGQVTDLCFLVPNPSRR